MNKQQGFLEKCIVLEDKYSFTNWNKQKAEH